MDRDILKNLHFIFTLIGEKKGKDLPIKDTQSGDQKKFEPHIVTTHPSGNLVISMGSKSDAAKTKVENTTSTSKKSCSKDLEISKPAPKYQKTNNEMNVEASDEDQISKGLKITEKPNLSHVDNNSTIIKSSELNF